MGATAAQSLLGRDFRVTQHRGERLDSDLAELVTATIHQAPSCAVMTKMSYSQGWSRICASSRLSAPE
jgi:hypothetical protein